MCILSHSGFGDWEQKVASIISENFKSRAQNCYVKLKTYTLEIIVFVNIGVSRNAVLYVKDYHSDTFTYL